MVQVTSAGGSTLLTMDPAASCASVGNTATGVSRSARSWRVPRSADASRVLRLVVSVRVVKKLVRGRVYVWISGGCSGCLGCL